LRSSRAEGISGNGTGEDGAALLAKQQQKKKKKKKKQN
jgi:hypothetical protein